MYRVLISLNLTLVYYNTSLITTNSTVAGQTSRAVKNALLRLEYRPCFEIMCDPRAAR